MGPVLVLILVMFHIDPVSAEIYKWTDKGGSVHFGDRPPSDKAETIEPNTDRIGFEGLRRGERQMLREREARIQEHVEAREQAVREEKRAQTEAARREKECDRIEDEIAHYKGKLREGCTPGVCAEYERMVDKYEAQERDMCGG